MDINFDYLRFLEQQETAEHKDTFESFIDDIFAKNMIEMAIKGMKGTGEDERQIRAFFSVLTRHGIRPKVAIDIMLDLGSELSDKK